MMKRILFLLVAASFGACSPSQGQTASAGPDESLEQWLDADLPVQDDPWSEGVAGIGLILRRLDGVKRVLMIGAHPDDEDTSLLAALSRGMGVETAYLALTRGEGGQNLIGPELDEGLGLVRTGELLSARSIDGARQFFSRAFDFGYSKTADETFGFWPRDELLADVTWVVRTFRPQVIISVFSGTPRDGHGHHQVAGIIAHEVFDVAGDPARFPEQLSDGVTPWAPQKLYLLTRRNPEAGTTGVETGVLDPLLGRSYLQIAMESRSQHRSQDMGVGQPMGPRRSTVALVKAREEVVGPDKMFAGVDTALVALAANLPEDLRDPVVGRLQAYRDGVQEAKESVDLTDPWGAAPPLGRALEALQESLRILDQDDRGKGSMLSGMLRDRLPLVEEALLRAAGIVVEAELEDGLVVPGESVRGVVEVWNGGPYSIRRAGAWLQGPEGWSVSATESGADLIAPGALESWRFQVTVPSGASPSPPYYMTESRAGELYRWPKDTERWGAPGDPALVHGQMRLQVGDLAEVAVWEPARFRGVDKARGEYVEPVLVLPTVAVSLEPTLMAWPSTSRDSREVTLTVRSYDTGEVRGRASLSVPDGWSVEPAGLPIRLSEEGAETSVTFMVTRPSDLPDGDYSVVGQVQTQDGRVWDQAVTLVDYPHIHRSALFPRARARVSVFPVSVAAGLRVGYVMGSGDEGPAAIRQMGAEVELLGPEILRSGDLEPFDVVVLGIRAYETRPDLVAANDRLLQYVSAGGTLIVQYNKYEFAGGGFAPYPVAMVRPHDRVTDETAPVRILDPTHPVFTEPNKIGPGDFDGWAQERGLYFLSTWGEQFTPLLEMADPGEEPKRGSLLVAPLGEGLYVYTGLAFFRQFPEGVSGAYRLFANLLSLGRDGPR